MRLPDNLQRRSYVEWNYLVKGLVEVWEILELLHLEHYLEARLESDDGSLAERLGQLGNKMGSHREAARRVEYATLLSHLQDCPTEPSIEFALEVLMPSQAGAASGAY